MKWNLLCMAIAMTCGFSQAQVTWNTSGNNISNANTGNVNIGGAGATDAKLSVSAPAVWQFRMMNTEAGGTEWRLGSSSNSWGIGAGKFVICNGSTSTNASLVIDASRNVGIGSYSPTQKLEVNGNLNLVGTDRRIFLGSTAGSTFGLALSASSPNHGIFYKDAATDYISIAPNGQGASGVLNVFADNKVGIGTTTPAYTLDVNGTINSTSLNSTSLTSSSIVTNTVRIGTSLNPSGYKLAVGGKIISEEVVIKLQANWPDYVFDSKYKLPTLYEVEQFITTEKHLPGVPAAAEIAKNGVAVGEMNAVLLEKIEELTLYMIELKKQNDQLQQQVNKLIANQK